MDSSRFPEFRSAGDIALFTEFAGFADRNSGISFAVIRVSLFRLTVSAGGWWFLNAIFTAEIVSFKDIAGCGTSAEDLREICREVWTYKSWRRLF